MVTNKYNVGFNKSDDFSALRDEMISELVYLNTLEQMEFVDAVVMKDTPTLDKHLRFPKDNTLPTYEIAEGSSSEYQTIGWFEQSFSLNKFRTKLMIDDESKIRLDEATQWEYSIAGVSKGMARARDYNIMSKLIKGAGVSTDAAIPWNKDHNNLINDIADVIEAIFEKDTQYISERDLDGMILYYPLKLWPYMRTPEMLMDGSTTGGKMGRLLMSQSQVSWASGEFNVRFRGSAKLNTLDKVIGVIPGNFTASHYSYTGGQIPHVEQTRDADEGGDAWMVTQYYGTHVMPMSFDQQTTNDRIVIIDKVFEA